MAQPATPQRERGPASRSGLSRERGHLARMDNRGPSARCGPEARAPRRHHHCHSKPSWPSRPPRNVKGVRRREAACPGSAGILPAWTTAGLRPVAGQRPALPGDTITAIQNPHGPAGVAPQRERGPASRSGLSCPGARASCPHGQPRAFGPLRARGPRSQETPSLPFKTLMAQPATPQRERGPASRSGLSRERGHLARMDNRGPSARCGPEARAPGKTAHGSAGLLYFHGEDGPCVLSRRMSRDRPRL